MRILAFIVAFLLTSNLLTAQDALFNHYGKSEGLSSNEIYDIAQDNAGRIWVATSKGLVTLEGLSFQLNPSSRIVQGSFVVGFFESEGILGCYTAEGRLFYIKDNKVSPIALNTQLQSAIAGKIVNQARIDDAGNIWMSNIIGSGLIEIQPSTRKVVNHDEPGAYKYIVRQLSDNNYIVGSSKPTANSASVNQLKVFFNEIELEISLSGNSEYNKSKFSALQNKSYLFSAGDEVVNFSEKGILARLFTEKKVECLFEDSEQKIWIGLNQGGVICFPTGDISSRNRIEYLAVAEDALEDIRIVPNPYYAYSKYETSKLDNRIIITNLPQTVTVRIYTINGTLVRTLEKDDDTITFLEWDLKNQSRVPIASGMYIYHIDAPGIGETILKWMAVMRPIDLDNF